MRRNDFTQECRANLAAALPAVIVLAAVAAARLLGLT
jgi:hypothetical protein